MRNGGARRIDVDGVRLDTGEYDAARTIGMADPDGVPGIYSGVSGLFKRYYSDANRDSRARNDDAQSRWKKCWGSGASVAVEGIAAKRGGSRL